MILQQGPQCPSSLHSANVALGQTGNVEAPWITTSHPTLTSVLYREVSRARNKGAAEGAGKTANS